MNKPIASPARATLQPTNEFLERSLDELAEECAQVLGLLARLRDLPEGEARDALDGRLYASLSHLRLETHAIMQEWDRLVDRLSEE